MRSACVVALQRCRWDCGQAAQTADFSWGYLLRWTGSPVRRRQSCFTLAMGGWLRHARWSAKGRGCTQMPALGCRAVDMVRTGDAVTFNVSGENRPIRWGFRQPQTT